MTERHAPNSVNVVKDRDGLKYLRISFMTTTRWVLDVMYQSGARKTYDLIEGDRLDRDTLLRSITPSSQHVSHGAAGPACELALSLFGDPVRLSISRVRPVVGQEPLEGGEGEWQECVLACLVRRFSQCQFEGLLEMLRLHYGLPADGI